jgi:hypothetical protein
LSIVNTRRLPAYLKEFILADATVEGFSLSHAAILDGTTGLEEQFGDIYGIRSGSLELDQDSYDNTGDDAILSTWYWANKVNVTIQSGYVPFETLSLISGSKVTSSGSGANQTFSLPLWEENSMNTTPRPLLIRVPSKDKSGSIRVLDFILFKVQFQPFSFDGPAYKEGLLLNYNGSALFSEKDEKGNPVLDSRTGLPTKAIGRLFSHPLG